MTEHTVPQHVAIVMDGNGRWAKKRFLPRIAGHKAGVETVRTVIKHCVRRGIKALTIFAFSSENWRRPPQEVEFLMQLLATSLERETEKLHKENVKICFIGDRSPFSAKLSACINAAENLTKNNTGLVLVIAVNYGGQWDILEATRHIAKQIEAGTLSSQDISLELFQSYLSTAGISEPDLFIRTSGEQRISNFLLWQLAYTEFYFTEVCWPDFSEKEFDKALAYYADRERRFGYISEQLAQGETHA